MEQTREAITTYLLDLLCPGWPSWITSQSMSRATNLSCTRELTTPFIRRIHGSTGSQQAKG